MSSRIGQMKKSAIRSIEDTESVFARFHFQIGEEFSVHKNRIAKNFWSPRRLCIVRHRIEQLCVAIEDPVVDDQRNLVSSLRQIQGVFEFVTHKKYTQQACKDVEPVDAQGVVVVPQHGCILTIWIVVQS